MKILLPLGLGLIMFSLGVSLQTADFRRVLSTPRSIGLGLLLQVFCLPALALCCIKLFALDAPMAIGVMLIAACPGGVSAGLLTLLAGGETALSVSLTAITSLSVLVTLPLTINLALMLVPGAEMSFHFPVLWTGGGIFMIALLPVSLGMALRAFLPMLAARLLQPLSRLSTLIFLAIVLATFIDQRELILENLPHLGPMLLLLNVLIMGLGFLAGRWAGLGQRVQIALAMESGLHNAALGIFVATTLLAQPALAIPSVVYAFLMNITAIAFIALQKALYRDRPESAAAQPPLH